MGPGVRFRAVGALNVYLTFKEACQAAGIARPEYVENRADYYFAAEDGSVFVVREPNWFNVWGSPDRLFVAGPKIGQREEISSPQAAAYREQAEKEWGKYIPGNWLVRPSFKKGKQRETLPIVDEWGRKIGYVDEDGDHKYPDYLIGPGA